MSGAPRRSSSAASFVISVAAELAGMHPQTLRQYDRLGLVTPERTKGRGRRYTQRHVERLREIQRLSQDEGINLAGIQRILALENEVVQLRAERDRLRARVAELEERRTRVFAASTTGEVRQFQRGQRLPREVFAAQSRSGRSSSELALWHPIPEVHATHRGFLAAIGSGDGAVRVIEGEISTTVR